jgi:hypothetical protein
MCVWMYMACEICGLPPFNRRADRLFPSPTLADSVSLWRIRFSLNPLRIVYNNII